MDEIDDEPPRTTRMKLFREIGETVTPWTDLWERVAAWTREKELVEAPLLIQAMTATCTAEGGYTVKVFYIGDISIP